MPATRLFERAIVRLSPRDASEDVAGFLQGLVTSDVAGPLPVWAGLLTPQGKALFDFLVWPSGALRHGSVQSELLLDCEASAAEALVRRLAMYRLRRAIDIAVDPGVAVHWAGHPGDGGARDPRLPALGERWLAPAGVAGHDEPADAAWRAHRLRLGVAEGRAELGDGELLWLECNAAELNGVSFSKGCYVGQENTARMNWRNKVLRRLVVVPLEWSDPARQRAAWPELGVALDHRRIETIDPAWLPDWLREAVG